MAAPSTEAERVPGNLILVPAVITLAVTLLRLVGELQHWSPTFFSPAAGGGFAVVGISWLVPIFGIYFAVKLARAGEGPSRVGLGVLLVVLAIAVMPLSGFVARAAGMNLQGRHVLLVFAAASLVGIAIAWQAWPQLGRVLLLYALAARVPVALLMFAAIYGNWGTHYDVAPPGLPAMTPLHKWVWIGLLPQMTIWLWFTVTLGALFGLIAGAIAGRGKTAHAAAA